MKASHRFFYVSFILPQGFGWVLTGPKQRQSLRTTSFLSMDEGEGENDFQGGVLHDKFILEKGQKSTSGKSNIFTAYEKCSETGDPMGDKVVIKFSDDNKALERELVNFETLNDELFVEIHEYIEECYFDDETGVNCEPLENNAALVMERGAEDLKHYLNRKGTLQEAELRSVAWTVVQCLEDMHSKGMVWTDLKAQNLVMVPKEARHEDGPPVKGIDVESAIPHKGSPIDFTPRGSPPEFAVRFLCGSELSMQIEYNFDIWSLGMLLHEMATGKHYFEEGEHVDIATQLKNTAGLDVDDVADEELGNLIRWCLDVEPSNRPTIDQVAEHAYFTKSDHQNIADDNDSFGNLHHRTFGDSKAAANAEGGGFTFGGQALNSGSRSHDQLVENDHTEARQDASDSTYGNIVEHTTSYRSGANGHAHPQQYSTNRFTFGNVVESNASQAQRENVHEQPDVLQNIEANMQTQDHLDDHSNRHQSHSKGQFTFGNVIEEDPR